MLNRASRLDRKALDSFFHKKTAYKAGNFVSVRFVRNGLKKSRYGAVISFAGGVPKKGRAVPRNLARRRILEAVRTQTEDISPGWDVVFFAKLNSKSAPKYAEIKTDIINVLHSAHLY